MNKWKHKQAKESYPYFVKLLGKPTFSANVPHGMAYWKKIGSGLFAEHLLRDEAVKHCVPAPHTDFFYSSIKFYVPPDMLKRVLSISGSINYDGLKKLLTARCASMGANLATLYLAMALVSGKMSFHDIKKKGLYGKYIREEVISYPEMRKEMLQMKKKNNKKYKKDLEAPFYKLAFPHC